MKINHQQYVRFELTKSRTVYVNLKSKLMLGKPEDKDEEAEKSEESGDVVHRAQHDHQLVT